MSSEDQATAYLEEAKLTLQSARTIHTTATEDDQDLWAQIVKNGYDAIEQAASAGIAAKNETIPRTHPGKINTFLDQHPLPDDLEDALLTWLRRRSSSQYVDIRGDEINVPHEQFDRADAEAVLDDAETFIQYVSERVAEEIEEGSD